jgi:radical SAM-linked protein
MVRLRVRLRFRKEHDLRLISHRDLVRTMERLFRRADLSLSMSEGFHPKPRMSFPSALAVGITGCDEVMELELSAEMTADAVQAALAPHLPPGLSIKSVEVMPPGVKKAAVRCVTFEVPVPAPRNDELRKQIARLWGAASHMVERDEDRGPIDVRSYLDELTLDGDLLRMRLRVTPLGTARPREVLRALGVEDLESQGFQLSRTAVELET